MKQIPNALTVFRILITPVFLSLLWIKSSEHRLLAVGLYVIAGFTDWLDGHSARTYKAKTRLGQFLDPLADKILVLGTFVLLPFLTEAVPWWAVISIAIRDLGITALRSWAESHDKPIPTLRSAQWKTTVQLLFLLWIVVLLWGVVSPSWATIAERLLNGIITQIILYFTVAFTLWTGIEYVQKTFAKPEHNID